MKIILIMSLLLTICFTGCSLSIVGSGDQSPPSIVNANKDVDDIRSIHTNSKYGDIIVVTIDGGEIGITEHTYPYVPLRFEIARGEQKVLLVRQMEKPTKFVQMNAAFSKDGDLFYLGPGMNSIDIKSDEMWRYGKTYYPKDVKFFNGGIAAKGIKISIIYKPVSSTISQ